MDKSWGNKGRAYRQAGQLVVEAIIAIAILVTAVLIFLGALSRSLGFNRVIADQYVGTYLASEGIEIVKNIVDANYLQKKPWNDGLADGDFEAVYDDVSLGSAVNRQFYFDKNTGKYTYDSCVDCRETSLTRIISIERIGGGEIRINSRVNWKNRGLDYSINLEDHFFDWR